MKVTRLAEWFNVRAAWHGPADVSPVGHAANAHIDLTASLGHVQVYTHFDDGRRPYPAWYSAACYDRFERILVENYASQVEVP